MPKLCISSLTLPTRQSFCSINLLYATSTLVKYCYNRNNYWYNITYYKSFWQLPSNKRVSQRYSELHPANWSTVAVGRMTVHAKRQKLCNKNKPFTQACLFESKSIRVVPQNKFSIIYKKQHTSICVSVSAWLVHQVSAGHAPIRSQVQYFEWTTSVTHRCQVTSVPCYPVDSSSITKLFHSYSTTT